ncbi:MAG: hypothetical protein MUE40_12860 [Anaerolineae bacterium]|nr:hypothetical protein [Anaerolineae bacterium]
MSEAFSPAVSPPLRLMSALHATFSGEAAWLLPVPGRAMWAAGQPRPGLYHTVHLPDRGLMLRFAPAGLRRGRRASGAALPASVRYLAGAARLLLADGLPVPLITALIVGDEPAGPRYEHSLGLALLALWHTAAGQPVSESHLLLLMERVEREYR